MAQFRVQSSIDDVGLHPEIKHAGCRRPPQVVQRPICHAAISVQALFSHDWLIADSNQWTAIMYPAGISLIATNCMRMPPS
jgi:hypothetical protein